MPLIQTDDVVLALQFEVRKRFQHLLRNRHGLVLFQLHRIGVVGFTFQALEIEFRKHFVGFAVAVLKIARLQTLFNDFFAHANRIEQIERRRVRGCCTVRGWRFGQCIELQNRNAFLRQGQGRNATDRASARDNHAIRRSHVSYQLHQDVD